jgi:hypothetical protein
MDEFDYIGKRHSQLYNDIDGEIAMTNDERIRSYDEMADSRSYARNIETRIEEEDELEEGDWDAFDSDELEDEYDPDDLD